MTLLWLIAFANTITAAPSIVLPINSQVPPVARASEAFQFAFSESTFSSTAPSIDYSLSNAPKWLQLDSSGRTLSGTPGSGDTGSVPFDLIATDSTGSTSMSVTLVVSSDPGPGLGIPLSDQLRAHGAFTNPNSLLMPHSTYLSISFLPNTFINTDDHTLYYAICANNTPLPSWINFNSNTLSFTGTTPQATSPVEISQQYDMKLTASDVAGFSGATVEFQIIVESHVFAFSKILQTINATQGAPFNFSELLTDLLLDGNPANRSDINQITADTPSWVTLDQSSLIVSGTPPVSAAPENFTVIAKNIYGDVAETTIAIEFSEVSQLDLFKHPIDSLNATAGKDFEYNVDRSLLLITNTTFAADLGEAASWLKFDPDSLRLYGSVPSDIQPQQDLVNITTIQGSQSYSQTIRITVGRNENGGGVPTESANILGPGSTSRPPGMQPMSNVVKKRWLPVAIAIPVVVILGILLSFYLCVRKMRRKRLYFGSHGPSKEKISRPMPTDDSWITIQDNETVEKAGDARPRNLGFDRNRTSTQMQRRESSRPPKVEIRGLLASSPNKRGSLFRRSRSGTDHKSSNLQRDSWREYICNFHGVRPDSIVTESGLIREEERPLRPKMKHRFSRIRQSDLSRYSSLSDGSRVKRYSRHGKSRSGMSFASTSLFSSHHLHGFGRAGSGMGHGIRLSEGGLAHNYGGPHGFGIIRESWRNMSTKSKNTAEYATTTDSSSQHLTSKHSENFVSLVQAFPRPTPNTPDMFPRIQAIPNAERRQSPCRPTIRIVNSPPRTPLRRKSTLQAFHKHRVSSRQAQNPLFSAGPSSRASSHSLWKKSLKNTTLPNSQSMNSLPPEPTHPPQTASQPTRTPQRSYSQSSSLSPPVGSIFPNPSPRYPRHNAFTPFTHLSTFPSQSRTSLTSSQQFGSADDDADNDTDNDTLSADFYDGDPTADLEENIDDDGNKFWQHTRNPNPLGAPHHALAAFDPNRADNADRVRKIWRSYPRSQLDHLWAGDDKYDGGGGGGTSASASGGGGGSMAEERRFVVGTQERRPVSVDVQGGLGKGASMKGDFQDGSAFV